MEWWTGEEPRWRSKDFDVVHYVHWCSDFIRLFVGNEWWFLICPIVKKSLIPIESNPALTWLWRDVQFRSTSKGTDFTAGSMEAGFAKRGHWGRSFFEGHLAEVDINRSGELHQSSNSIVALAPSWTCFWLVTLVRRTSEGYCSWCWRFTISLSLPSIRCFQRNSTTTRSWLAAWQAAPWMGGIEGVLWCELWEICLGPSDNLHTIQYPPSGWTGLVLFDTCGGLCQSWFSPQCWCSGHEARGRAHFLRHHS